MVKYTPTKSPNPKTKSQRISKSLEMSDGSIESKCMINRYDSGLSDLSPIESVTAINTAINTVTKENKENKSPKSKKPRCFKCNKKLGMYDIRCRCDKAFCALHLSSFDHNCTFDYKGTYETELIKNNPQIVADKLNRI
jgi:hypothetical protein